MLYKTINICQANMKKTQLIFGVLTIIILLTSCKNYYNDTITWMDNIAIGSSLAQVKKSQPDFIDIDWDNPDTLDETIRFRIDQIKGNNDILNMTHYLEFSDNKYEGRKSSK
jgi:hypothetical protein